MRFGRGRRAQHDIAVPRNETRQERSRLAPIRGLAVMLGSCIAFLAFLVLLTVVIHFVFL